MSGSKRINFLSSSSEKVSAREFIASLSPNKPTESSKSSFLGNTLTATFKSFYPPPPPPPLINKIEENVS